MLLLVSVAIIVTFKAVANDLLTVDPNRFKVIPSDVGPAVTIITASIRVTGNVPRVHSYNIAAPNSSSN
jgi:hypothetical protein